MGIRLSESRLLRRWRGKISILPTSTRRLQEHLRALEAATGHTIFLSICAGKSDPWMWAPNVGGLQTNMWRTGSDIVGPVVAGTPNAYKSMTCTKSCPRGASFQRVLRATSIRAFILEAQHTGFLQLDPDMMILGMPGLSDTENRVHMSLWAMSGAPLIIGADITALSPPSLGVLTNAAVRFKVDQDPLGLQAVRVAEPRTGLEVWAKKLSTPGERAVLLLNRTGEAASISVDWGDLGLLGSVASTAKDLWSEKKLPASAKPIAANVPSMDAVMLLVTGQEIEPTRYQPEEIDSPQTQNFATACSTAKEFQFAHVAARSKVAAIQILYANSDKLGPRRRACASMVRTARASSFLRPVSMVPVQSGFKPCSTNRAQGIHSPLPQIAVSLRRSRPSHCNKRLIGEGLNISIARNARRRNGK